MIDGSSIIRNMWGKNNLLPSGRPLKFALHSPSHMTNDEAEYETLIIDFTIAAGATVKNMLIKCDSQLVVTGDYRARDEKIKRYLDQTRASQ